jgi:hypothetical protein
MEGRSLEKVNLINQKAVKEQNMSLLIPVYKLATILRQLNLAGFLAALLITALLPVSARIKLTGKLVG